MSTSAVLTREEIISITGRRRKSAQCRWLRDNNIKFKPNALGHPQVGRAYYDQLAGSTTRRGVVGPDWSAPTGARNVRRAQGKDHSPL